ncbi:MAG: FemAB family PEP-CTERM system-associated protein [Calditrichae bacterium]|nr:FemAB family PEP-CTERM system-associated protein [Calditrichia bacterium]
MEIRSINEHDRENWNNYVNNHSDGSVAHMFEWHYIIKNSYGHECYYYVAVNENKILGIMPLVHIKSLVFGNQLVAVPFLTGGGILADNNDVFQKLADKAKDIMQDLNCNIIDLRSQKNLTKAESLQNFSIARYRNKVSMILTLPETDEELFKTFKYNLRRKINKPIKDGMKFQIGGIELLDDFYSVFTINMRDLGSPVHSKTYLNEIILKLADYSKIGIVYSDNIPVAGGFVFHYKNIFETPWISSLRKIKNYHNMFLYWSLMQFAISRQCSLFDFGRSTVGEGTYRFKEQWGAQPIDLDWYQIGLDKNIETDHSSTDSKFRKIMVAGWSMLPLTIANLLGPKIRGSISL